MMRKGRRRAARAGFFLLAAGLLSAGSAWGLPRPQLTPGGVAIIALPAEARKAYAGNLPVAILGQEPKRVAVVGIPLDAPVGKQHLKVILADGGQRSLDYLVRAHAYPLQSLQIEDQAKAEPDPAAVQRIWREQQAMKAGFTAWGSDAPPLLDFVWPVRGAVSSNFGLRRQINGQPRSPHSGLDIAAAEGTPVRVAGSGRVVLVEEFFLNGNSVMIDHGQGVKTLYCHLQSTGVKPGQVLAAGDFIGKVGKTGRVTGAHLHWAVSLNDARVDPRLFLPAGTDGAAP